MKKSTSFLPVLIIVLLVLCGCLILVLTGGGYALYKFGKSLPSLVANPPDLFPVQTPTPFQITRQPADQISEDTLKLVEQEVVPGNDPVELACRFKGVCDVPPTLPPPPQPYTVGMQKSFWVNNEDSGDYFKVNATLQYITPHSYFWVAEGVNFDLQEAKTLMDTFENKIYPTDREFFGSEWTPGVDDDPHIYVLYTSGLGSNVAGYYYSPDEYNPKIFQYSNAHEMFFISSSEPLASDYTFGTLAHEFQHMIHWYQDRNESAFMNEGFSELATFINGYDNGGFDQIYLSDTDGINLTDWLGSSGDNSAHYGASFLFVTYFLDRFGDGTTKALIHDQQNGLDSIDKVLAEQQITDPLTKKTITADDFFLDWAVTNIVQDGSVGDGRYVYHNYASAPSARLTETVSTCPLSPATRTVNEYGVDYIRITCTGKYDLRFEGSTSIRLVPADPHSGKFNYWSNLGDLSDMTLTREFDLGGVASSAPVTLNYWTWYDIEKDFDYVYVEASTDGQHWEILKTPSGTSSDPNGASYGWAYTGPSNGWKQESVDLSKYAGKKVSIRFEYLTDPAVNGQGFLLDDVSLPAIGYSTDFEQQDSSWVAKGFARIENGLPQTFRLAMVTRKSSGTSVEDIPVAADQTADIPVTIGQNSVQDVILVVSGTTRFTREIAPYQFSIK